MIIVFCQVEVSVTGRSLFQRNPTVCVCVCLYVCVCVCVRASVHVSLSIIKGNNNLYTYHR